MFEDSVKFIARRQDAATVVNGRPRQSVDIIHVHTTGPYALLLLLFGVGRKVTTAHITADSLMESIVGARQLHGLAQRYLRWFYNRSDLVIAVSEQTAIELGLAGVTKPITILPNLVSRREVDAVHDRRIAVRRQIGINSDDILVVSVGQAQPRKGVFEFLACAESLPGIRFAWVGGAIFGAASAGKSRIEKAFWSAPPNVLYCGSVSRERVYEYLAAADVYLSLSRQETFGLAVLEAAAAGCPLVLSDLPVFRRTYGEAALYVGAEGPTSLIAKLANDELLRRDLGRLARKIAIQHDWRDNGEALMLAYRQLAAQGGATA